MPHQVPRSVKHSLHYCTGAEILSATLVLLHVEYSATNFINFVSEIFMPLMILSVVES